MERLNASIECQQCLITLSNLVRDHEDDKYSRALSVVAIYIVDIERRNMELQLGMDMKKSKTYTEILRLLRSSLKE